MKHCIIIIFSLIINTLLISQVIEKPNFAIASHPISIEKIEITGNQTIVFLSIENQSETGYFCADKNISLIDAQKNTKYKLIQSKGIPVCPDNYKFSAVGEILHFQLIFPKIKPETKFINIVEECDQYCFSIKGIILDDGFNKEINLGYTNYTAGKADLALEVFKQTVKNHPDYPYGILYFNIIQIMSEMQDFAAAKEWYKKLSNSKFPDKNEVIGRLKQQSYYSKLVF